MQGLSELSFSAKKTLAPAGDEDERMIPAARESFMYFLVASLSGADRECRQPFGGEVPGCRSMVQSYGLCGGREYLLEIVD